jgi:hypothetical protein
MLPLDVGNYRDGSNIQMNIFWYIIYCTSAVFIVLILPFGIFYYESDEEKDFVILNMFMNNLLLCRNGVFGQQ